MGIIETLSMIEFSFWIFTGLGFVGVCSLVESMIKDRKYEGDDRFILKFFSMICYIIIAIAWIVGIVTLNLYYYLCVVSLLSCFEYEIYIIEKT